MKDRPAGGDSSLTRRLLACGVAAGPLFVAGFLLEGTRRPGYSHRRHPVSSLSLGPGGWRQELSFGAAGLLCIGFASGLSRANDGGPMPSLAPSLAPSLIGVAGVGLVGTGVFLTDPFNGYPDGTPDVPDVITGIGRLHDLSAAVILASMPAAQLLYARGFQQAGNRAWAVGSAATAVTMLAGAALSRAGFAQLPRFVDNAGLSQKVAIVAGFGWGTALALRALRAETAAPRRRHARR